jgi:hypothetical protein
LSSQPFVSFCINGHIAESVPEGCFNPEPLIECPYCHTKFFHAVFNWHDREPESTLIPCEPYKYEWVDVWTENIHGQVRVPVYEVSKIRKWIYGKDNEVYDRSQIIELNDYSK